jgi:tetratricopeptide (TPR) repeat protein
MRSAFVPIDAAAVPFPHVDRGANFLSERVCKPGGFCIHTSEGCIDMSRELDECLAPQTIVSYLNGSLRDDEKAEVDRHLDECRLCAGAVEGVTWLEARQEYLTSADSVLTRLRLRAASGAPSARQSPSRVWSARPYLALAATLVIFGGVTAYLTRAGGNEALFQQHFEPYPSTQPVVRGAATDTVSHALLLYESRDYRGALAAFEQVLKERPNDPAARFYAGLCQLVLGRSADAISNLEETRKLGAGELEGPAEWYLALGYLRHDIGEARSRLQRIAAGGGFYADQARALLPALDRL